MAQAKGLRGVALVVFDSAKCRQESSDKKAGRRT